MALQTVTGSLVFDFAFDIEADTEDEARDMLGDRDDGFKFEGEVGLKGPGGITASSITPHIYFDMPVEGVED